MCYFHVKENIRKRRHLVPELILEEMMDYLTEIHMSVNEKEFDQLLLSFKFKYSTSYPKMYEYIDEQWFKGNFNKWQIFRNPPGYANTNSNIESFKATLKRDFTGRRKLKVSSALKKLEDVIFYYSDADNIQMRIMKLYFFFPF
jgi:hypothetical protein